MAVSSRKLPIVKKITKPADSKSLHPFYPLIFANNCAEPFRFYVSGKSTESVQVQSHIVRHGGQVIKTLDDSPSGDRCQFVLCRPQSRMSTVLQSTAKTDNHLTPVLDLKFVFDSVDAGHMPADIDIYWLNKGSFDGVADDPLQPLRPVRDDSSNLKSRTKRSIALTSTDQQGADNEECENASVCSDFDDLDENLDNGALFARCDNYKESKKRVVFSRQQQIVIIKSILRRRAFDRLRGNSLWKEMESEARRLDGQSRIIGMQVSENSLPVRSWQSMKEHFRKKIVPHLADFTDVFGPQAIKCLTDAWAGMTVNCHLTDEELQSIELAADKSVDEEKAVSPRVTPLRYYVDKSTSSAMLVAPGSAGTHSSHGPVVNIVSDVIDDRTVDADKTPSRRRKHRRQLFNPNIDGLSTNGRSTEASPSCSGRVSSVKRIRLSPSPSKVKTCAVSPVKRDASPTKDRFRYSDVEDDAIVQFIIDKKAYERIGGNQLWITMAQSNCCLGRSWQSMKNRFLRVILTRLQATNAPALASLQAARGQNLVMPNRYTLQEDLELLSFLVTHRRLEDTKGVLVWEQMVIDGVPQTSEVCRTWQSLKERYRKVIVPNLERYISIAKESPEAKFRENVGHKLTQQAVLNVKKMYNISHKVAKR